MVKPQGRAASAGEREPLGSDVVVELASIASSCDASRSTEHVVRELERWGDDRLAELRSRIGPSPVNWSVIGVSLARQFWEALARVSQKQRVIEFHVSAVLRQQERSDGCREPPGGVTDGHASLPLPSCPPGLHRLLADCAMDWMNQLERVLDAVCVDAATIARTVSSSELGPLIRLDGWPMTADADQRLQVQFTSGARFRLSAEDPRLRSRICRGFEQLFAVVGEKLGISRCASVAGRVWTEVPEGRPPAGRAAVDRLSRRFGVLLAEAYVLRLGDCAPEDIVFRGDTPFLVSIGSVMRNEHAFDRRGGVDQTLSDSVLATGLLSVPSERDGARFGFVPLGHGSRSYLYEDRLEHDANGRPRIVPHALRAPQPDHLKWLRSDAVVEGFRRGYQALQENARHLFDGSWRGLRTVHSLRSRACYIETVTAAEHPHYLVSAAAREQAVRNRLEKLSAGAISSDIIEAEIAEILARRLPRFITSPSSRRLTTADRRATVGMFSQTGYQLSKRRHAHLNGADLRVQETLIRLALAPSKTSTKLSARRVDRSERLRAHHPRGFLAGAAAAGRWLADSAVLWNGSAGWFGLQQDDWADCRIRFGGPDLYHGQAGIALFLAYLGKATGCGEFTQLAASGIRGGRPALEDDTYWSGGGFSGRASVAFGALHVATLLRDNDLLSVVVKACGSILGTSERERVFDVVGGAAGAIAVALAVQRVTRCPELLAAARTAAGHLTNARAVDGHRCFWPTAMGHRGLAGFAHGTGGIAWALSRLAEQVGDDDLRPCIAQALAFEDAAYVPRHGNWTDFRLTGGVKRASALGWCHGAPGIGMARATLPARFFGAAEKRDLRRAVRAVTTRQVSADDSLCHGELGNLETLILASQRLQRQDLLRLARARGGLVLSRVLRSGTWQCGIGAEAPTPGLMVGVAGIGLAFLRLWNPDTIPSVLTLEPPPARL